MENRSIRSRSEKPAGAWTTVMAAQHRAAPVSPSIITRRRSNRSAIAPATGPKNPISANVTNIVAATQADERVSRQIAKLSAVPAANVPVSEIRRPSASLRTAARGGYYTAAPPF